MTIEFLPTEDILAEVVRQRKPGQLIVGFAAETENRLENGRAKLLRKGVDAIVVNDVSREGVGFDSDQNGATFLTATTAIDLPEMPKRKLADRILDEVVALRRPQSLLVELSGMETDSYTAEGADAGLFDSDRETVSGRRKIMIE
jgi:phosphopantothenoylcysteine decarboxylase / phosphopantothenate---cysteine ligase